MRRWITRLAIGLVTLVLVLIVAAKLLLRSGFAANRVAAEIQQAAGAPVHVGSLDIGVTGSSLRDLQFLEDGAAQGSQPWTQIADVDADMSLAQLVRGDFAGGAITLRRPKLTFRFDRNDNLLTKLPSFEGPSRAWPVFHIADGQITFQRHGSPDAVFTGINGTLQKSGDHITLSGAADDREWGQWTVNGDRADAAAPFQLTLHTDGVRATPEKLRRVPFVPLVTWEQVTLDGNTPVDLTLQFGGSQGGPAVRYRVALAPTNTTVFVSAIDLTARGASGKVLIEDGLVTLTDVAGNAAGGSLHLPKSVLDFRGTGSEQQYAVSGEKLRLRDLPKQWGLPAWDGRLSGHADLTVSTQDGQVQTKGGGAGVIDGFLSQKIEVKLSANDRGFKFDVSNAPGASLTPSGSDLAPKGRHTLAQGVSPGSQTETHIQPGRGDTVSCFAPSGLASSFGLGNPGLTPWAKMCRPFGANANVHPSTEVGDADDLLVTLLAAGLVTIQPAAAAPSEPAAKTIRINLGLTDVSIAELVQKLNVKLPIRLDGKVTFNVQATIPLGDAKNLKAYHATGTVESPWVRVEDLWLQQVKARITLENGVLRLDELSAHKPNSPPAAPPTTLLPGGTLTGTASLGIDPVGDLSANLKATALPIGPFLQLIPGGDPNAAGTIDGEAKFRAPAGALKDLTKWDGSGKFSGQGLRVQNIPADKFTGTIVLRGGAVDYAIKGETLGGTFDINGRYPSPPDGKAGEQGRAIVHGIDLSRLAEASRIDALKPLAGRFDFDANFTMADDPAGAGRVAFSALMWGGKPVADRLSGAVRVEHGLILIDELGGPLAGGTARLRLKYDYRHPERSNATLTAQRLDARTLLSPFSDMPPIDGPLDLRLFTRLGRSWSGTGQVLMGNGKLFGVTVRDAHFPLGWDIAPGRRGELRLHDAGAQASRGRLTGKANLSWGDAARLDGQVLFSGLDVGELLSHFSQTKVLGGLASGRVDLGGQDMHSAQDLTARVEAKLAQSAPGQIPVFQQILPMILPGVGGNMQFQSGDLRGQLSRGVFRIERLSLIGDLARVYAEGSVTLQQRLNLDVVANTNQLGIDPAVLQLLGLALPSFGPIPLGTLNQAVSYLSNRTISLRVTGTVKAPVARVSPVPFLTESVVRFFIAQAGVPVPTAALRAPVP
jgi:hypothetical protein